MTFWVACDEPFTIYKHLTTFVPSNYRSMSQEQRVGWTSPSNIAIVKYWGKYGRQLPRNASISFTLSAAHTKTWVAYQPKTTAGVSIQFLFEGQANPAFQAKLQAFLESILPEMPFLNDWHLEIHSENSFPHSAGIASSASAMSALALCLCDIERQLGILALDDAAFFQRASIFARLGSGSACRSVYPGMAAWGELAALPGSSNEYAVPYETHPVFKTFHDDIMIVSRSEKKVSSRAGHGLMEGNPYAATRYAQANHNLTELLEVLQQGDVNRFGEIAEDEALTLHALMMSSTPSFILMEPNSLEAIKRVRAFRERTGLPLYFTLDAGPNLHLLYPDSIAAEVQQFVDESLIELCQDGQLIRDRVGHGPRRI